MTIILVILLALVIAIALWILVLYNGLVTKRNRVDEGWSDIDVQLKRRHNLIPNLVEAVKGYMSHEKDTLNAVIEARNQAVSAEGKGDPKASAAAENALGGALKSLFMLVENYPNLKANENVLNLQNELTDTEDKIQASRRFYNGQVRDFNTATQKFPAVLIASMLGFKDRDFFEITDDSERAVPKVSLS